MVCGVLRVAILGGLGLGFCGCALYAAPMKLRVERRVNPLGIDVMRPVFSWQSDSEERNWRQTAYRIRVATSEAALAGGKANVWDSGKINSAESVGIAYSGPELKARQRYWWNVEVWDGAGRSASATMPSWWEMGLLSPSDWSAKWIRREDPEETREMNAVRWIGLPEAQPGQAGQPLKAQFRYTVHLTKKPFGASLHVFAPGRFLVKVNGVETGHKTEWSSFDREEISGQLHAGDNEIVIDVSAPKAKDPGQTFPAALAAVLRLGYSAEK